MTQTPAGTTSRTLTVVALVAATGGLLFGYDTAVINGANEYLRRQFALSPMQDGMAAASAIIGCIPGAMVAGFLSDRFGRRNVLFLCAILYAVSGLGSAIPQTFTQFLIARFGAGLAIGASSMICPVYVAEMAPAEKRGRLGTVFQLGIVVGIFVTLFINAWIQSPGDMDWNTTMGWRWMMGAEVVPAMLLLALLFFAPESPRWLVQAGRDQEARAVLNRIGGSAHAEREIAAVHQVLEQEEGRFTELFRTRFRRPLIIAVALMLVSQFSGINAIMYYSTRIFMTAGVGVQDAFAATVIVGLVNLLFTFVAVALIDRAGRRPLLLVGLAIQVAALGTVGALFLGGGDNMAVLLAILVFIAAFAMALGPIPWILCSEIFPTRIRGRAMSVATATIWIGAFIVAQTFPVLNSHPSIGPARTFFLYATCSLIGFLFVFLMIPETKGKSLEEIEAGW
jgi:SP family arabinose:H+ symporter-like MFS transporter